MGQAPPGSFADPGLGGDPARRRCRPGRGARRQRSDERAQRAGCRGRRTVDHREARPAGAGRSSATGGQDRHGGSAGRAARTAYGDARPAGIRHPGPRGHRCDLTASPPSSSRRWPATGNPSSRRVGGRHTDSRSGSWPLWAAAAQPKAGPRAGPKAGPKAGPRPVLPCR
ncbi:hypothetical protein DMB66_33375 [Actinoplanes sp. ATCC 53533]|nr:hypothetical protein DMB66_33375 [Actinoplanes sp. ATCC 53533]